MGIIPLLHAVYHNRESVTLTQSLTMLDFLEESYPGTQALIPPITDHKKRCQVRDLTNMIACVIEPMQTDRLLKSIRMDTGGDPLHWVRKKFCDHMEGLERILNRSPTKYSAGDEVSTADVCLIPLVKRAEMFGLTLDNNSMGKRVPKVAFIVQECEKLEAFRQCGVPKYTEQSEVPNYARDFPAILNELLSKHSETQDLLKRAVIASDSCSQILTGTTQGSHRDSNVDSISQEKQRKLAQNYAIHKSYARRRSGN